MTRPSVSVTIITLNEADNIARAIQSVAWAEEVIVVDSGSTDETVSIAKSLGAKVLHHPWSGYGQQKNYAQNLALNDWILNLDADEAVSPALGETIQRTLSAPNPAPGYSLPRKTYYLGQWIRHGGWYPNYLVRLADRRHARWSEPNVHEELQVDGMVSRLNEPLDHYAFQSIQDQILTNLRFSHLGSQDLARAGQRPSLFRLVWKPWGKFIETYFLKRGFLDGLPGFIIAVNAAHSMFLKYAYLTETGIRNKNTGTKAQLSALAEEKQKRGSE